MQTVIQMSEYKKIDIYIYNSEHQQKQQANTVTNKRLWQIMNAQE